MDMKQNNFDHYEMVMWHMVQALSDVKDCVESSEERRHDGLINLQTTLMETQQWINRYTIE